jgi:hypothetical protein
MNGGWYRQVIRWESPEELQASLNDKTEWAICVVLQPTDIYPGICIVEREMSAAWRPEQN